MPIPPPRRKSGRESSPALANSSSCRVSRLPRIVASTTKATDPVEPKQKDYFKRNDSVRLTFTKTSTQSKNVDPKLMIKTSNQVGIKAVKTEAKDGTFVKNATNTFSKSQNNESKNESSLLNNSNKAFDLNSSSSTNASSLNLSNLHPTVCNSFESHPDTSFNAKESSAPSKALPKRNKLPAPKVQRTSSLNGKLTSPQHVSDKSAKINKASTTPNNSISRSPSREKPLRSKKIIRSISSDQPVEELKTGCKPCHSESSLHQKVSAPARPNRSKIPLSKNSSSKPSLRNTLSKESINKMRVNNLKSAENENDLKSEEKSKLSSVLSAPESNSNSQTNIESKNSEKACQGRKKKPDSVLPLDEKKSLNEPLSREENKVIDKKSNASIADFSVRSSLLKPPRQSATLRRAISLRNPIKNAVSNSVENKQNLAAPDGTNDCHLSTLSERKITCEPVDDMSKKLSSESSHVKRLTQPNIGLGDNNSPKSFLIDSADFDSSKKDVLSNKQPSDLYYKTAETKLSQSQSCTKSNLTGVLKESKEASKPSFITDEIKPLENINSSMCQEQDNTVENSQVSFQSVNLKGIMNSLQGQQSVKEEGQPNYLSLKKQKHLINEKLEPKPSFSKRFSGPVEKKVNKVRGKSDYETDVCYKSTLKGVTSGILSGSNSHGEIPLLCSTVLPVSSKSDLIQSEVIHQCQSWPVKNTISDHVEVIMENSESKEENNAPSDSVTNGIAKKENSVKTPQIKKPARPSLLRRALSSSALVTKKNGESQETKPCNYVSSEILTAEEDRTIVQIMTGVKQICKFEETVASNISVHQQIKTGEPNFETRELENAERSSLDNFLCVQQINSSDATGDKFESPLETRKCAERSNLDKLLCIKQTNNLETAIEDYHEHLLETRKLEYAEKPTLDNLSCMKQINSSEKIKSGAVNNFNIAEKTDHPQIISRISIPTECELEDSLVRTKLTKIGATQANDTGHDVQYCPVSDIEQQSMFISGFSQCEFDPTVFKQKFLTPQKRQNKSINCVLSSECSPSRSVSPAKSIKEYETLCANIKRRNSELYPESVCTQASSERSRNASPAGYNVGGLGTTRRLYPQEVRPLPPLPPTTPSVHHDTVYATIRPKTSATETYEYPRYDPYGTYGRSRSETYAKYKEYPRTVGFIPQPLNPRELLLSINSTYLANESDYTDYMDAMPGQYTGSEFRPRVQDESSKLRGYGLKAKILRKMSTFSKPKSEPQFDTFYKKKNDILDYATAPDSAQRKLYHSVSRELLSKMEAERQSIKGGGLSVEEIEDFQVLRDEKTPELAEAILYERSNPPVLSSRFARVDLIEDPAYHSALMVIGGERKVVPLHRENLDTSDSRKNGECQYISPQNTWPKNIAFRSHSTGSPESHSCHPEYRENITGGTLLNENKVTSVDDDCSMAKNKNFKSQSAWDLRRPWSEASSNRSSGSIAPHRPNGPCEYSAGESRSHSPAPSIGSEGVLQKFRKSFSLRFHRRVPKANEESVDVPLSSQEGTDNLGNDTTFRFGPLAWRASKERKRSKKAVSSRNSKCNSGDSGIQVTRPPSTDFEGLNFVNEFPPTVTQGSPEVNSCTTVPESYVPGSSATAPHSPAEATNPVWLSQVPPSSSMDDGTAKLRRSSSQPLHNDDTKEPRRPSPEGCEVDLGVGYSSEDDLDVDEVTQRYNERVLDPLAIREELLDAVALYDYKGEGPGELSFRKGDSILIGQHSYDDWWYGTCGATSGWLPATFVKVKSSQGIKEPEKHTSIAQLRSNVVNEILQTERDYVKHLEDIVEGYMAQMQRRQDMFSSDQIVTVFGNIGPLYEFQKRFLRDLESSYNQEKPNETGIGSCFLRHISSFEVYSDYCTQHGRAVAELQNLYANERTAHFLEACRLLRGMADIALDGFLLTPVQRICKYPLQLAELLKHTEESHADFNDVSQALHSMREVATLINERKRMLEGKERLNEWQKLVENWQGGNLAEKSSELIYSGDLQKVSHGGWAKDITMYLFDRQAILCKKDMIKRNSLTYKTRFSTEGCEAVSISGGKDAQYNATVKFAFKVRDSSDKWYLFSCKTLKDRDTWLAAFARDRLLQQGEGFRSLPDGASFDSIRRLEGKANKAVYDRQRLRHIKNRPRAKKIDPVSVLSLQDVTDEGAAIRLDSSRKSSWFSIGSNRSKKRTLLTSPSEV
ncbi:uncharacterized protein LOC136037398 [Artemia franciscana]|uniref:Uncharacterized protein n=1 Tax=Artemia franciscana TaxID=6661 RepID=A0AA88I230_ARTSF|nr:hypothetical protein QYM36_005216 [Artemia franciscana]